MNWKDRYVITPAGIKALAMSARNAASEPLSDEERSAMNFTASSSQSERNAKELSSSRPSIRLASVKRQAE